MILRLLSSVRDIRGNVAFVRFNNASHRNAMTGAMMSDFEKIVNLEIPQYDGKAIVLTGEAHGKAFCAGSDFECLQEFRKRFFIKELFL